MKTKVISFMAIVVLVILSSCGDNGSKQDNRLYGTWLFAGVDQSGKYYDPPRSNVDILWNVDKDSVFIVYTGVNHIRGDSINSKETLYNWYTNNGIIYTEDKKYSINNAWKYKFSVNGALILLSMGETQDNGSVSNWQECYFCNVEAVRQ